MVRTVIDFVHFTSLLGILEASFRLLSPLAKFFTLHSSLFT